jgi:hypothetical protein
MATTIDDARTDPRIDLDAVQQWIREHGYTPNDIRPTVTVLDDGTVLLERIHRSYADGGRPRLRRGPHEPQVDISPLTVRPHRPFPLEDT